MSVTAYLVVMLVVIGVAAAVSVPSLFFAKCTQCGKRNGLEATICKFCGASLGDRSS